MNSKGFHISRFDSCVYLKGTSEGSCIYLLIYVDDMLIMSKNMAEIEKLKKSLKSEFDMKDLGAAKQILGIDIIIDRMKGTLSLT